MLVLGGELWPLAPRSLASCDARATPAPPQTDRVTRGAPRERLDKDAPGPLRQTQDSQLPRTDGHDQRPRLSPARRPRPRPRTPHADPHQPAAAHAETADRTLRPALGHRKPAIRTDPRLPPRLALLPSPARRRLRRRPDDPRRHHLPPLRPHPAQRLPQPNPGHDPPPANRRKRRTPLHPRPHRDRATPPHPHPRAPPSRLREPPNRGPLVGRTHPQLQLSRPLSFNRITGPAIEVSERRGSRSARARIERLASVSVRPPTDDRPDGQVEESRAGFGPSCGPWGSLSHAGPVRGQR
jgi:hypothetical protein